MAICSADSLSDNSLSPSPGFSSSYARTHTRRLCRHFEGCKWFGNFDAHCFETMRHWKLCQSKLTIPCDWTNCWRNAPTRRRGLNRESLSFRLLSDFHFTLSQRPTVPEMYRNALHPELVWIVVFFLFLIAYFSLIMPVTHRSMFVLYFLPQIDSGVLITFTLATLSLEVCLSGVRTLASREHNIWQERNVLYPRHQLLHENTDALSAHGQRGVVKRGDHAVYVRSVFLGVRTSAYFVFWA